MSEFNIDTLVRNDGQKYLNKSSIVSYFYSEAFEAMKAANATEDVKEKERLTNSACLCKDYAEIFNNL